MTAQERKDFRRVQKSRDVWKKRAVGRGEDRRRFRERHKEVDWSRAAWRDRALAAAQIRAHPIVKWDEQTDLSLKAYTCMTMP